ncbi:MAG TPA: NUDIX domain-containing protein [Anaerolineae bacterium]
MRIATNGIVIDEYGRVLLIRRDDTRMLAPPGGGLEAGELPIENVAGEVREETGLIVMPVRLTGLYFWPMRPDESALVFTFRCIMRGGNIQTSAESPKVGFFKTNPLPRSILGMHRERVEDAWHHAGGPPYWRRQELPPLVKLGRFFIFNVLYPWRDWRRHWRNEPAYVAPPSWQVGAFAVIGNEQGQVLWVRRTDKDAWNLPGGGGNSLAPPWETAVRETREETGLRVTLTDLTGVYVFHEEAHMVLIFTAEVAGGKLTTGAEAAEFAYFTPGEEPDNALPRHVERVADAVGSSEETVFRLYEG